MPFLSNCRQVEKRKATGPFTSLQCILFLTHAGIHSALDASGTQSQMHFLNSKRNQETRKSSTKDFLSYQQYPLLKCPSVGTNPSICSQVPIFPCHAAKLGNYSVTLRALHNIYQPSAAYKTSFSFKTCFLHGHRGSKIQLT